MSRKRLKKATPWLISGFAFCRPGDVVEHLRAAARRSSATNVLPKRSRHSLSSQREAAAHRDLRCRRRVLVGERKSMYSGTFASVALPDARRAE